MLSKKPGPRTRRTSTQACGTDDAIASTSPAGLLPIPGVSGVLAVHSLPSSRARPGPVHSAALSALRAREASGRGAVGAEEAQRAAHVGVLAGADVAAVGWPRRVPGAVLGVGEQRAIADVGTSPRRWRVGQHRFAVVGVGGSEREPDLRHEADALNRRAVG